MAEQTRREQPVVAVYTPESRLRAPIPMAREMWCDLMASRELGWRLMVRDIKAQYRQSLLGLFWAFVPPVATALVFIVLNARQIINIGDTGIPYPAFVLFGTVLWQIFVESLNAPLKVVTASKAMLSKIKVPGESLILCGLGKSLFSSGIKLLVLAVVFVIYQIPPTWGLPFFFLGVLVLVFLGTALGLLITPIGLLYTDVAQALAVVTGLWFFITPVVYPPPTHFPYSLLTTLNPVSPILVATRDLATTGSIANAPAFFAVTALTFLVFCFGWLLYRLAIPIIVERTNA